jgi:hypothetical protein
MHQTLLNIPIVSPTTGFGKRIHAAIVSRQLTHRPLLSDVLRATGSSPSAIGITCRAL